MMSQTPVAHRMAPLVVEYVEEDTGPRTLYSFEPDATALGFVIGATLGLGIEVPYYFALAPNYDFTFHPQYLSKQGILWQGEPATRGCHDVPQSAAPTRVPVPVASPSSLR